MEEMYDESKLGADRSRPRQREERGRGKPYDRPPPSKGDVMRR